MPCLKLVDLADAKKRIKAAKDGVLFLMFNPGPKNTLLNAVLELDPKRLFIHGIANQDPGGSKAPLIKLTHKGKRLPPMSFDAILPAALQRVSTWFDKVFTFNRVMIHGLVRDKQGRCKNCGHRSARRGSCRLCGGQMK